MLLKDSEVQAIVLDVCEDRHHLKMYLLANYCNSFSWLCILFKGQFLFPLPLFL